LSGETIRKGRARSIGRTDGDGRRRRRRRRRVFRSLRQEFRDALRNSRAAHEYLVATPFFFFFFFFFRTRNTQRVVFSNDSATTTHNINTRVPYKREYPPRLTRVARNAAGENARA